MGRDLSPILAPLMPWGDQYAPGPEGPPVVLTHRGDCGAPVHQRLSCEAGHELTSPREITTVPGPGARRIA